MCEADGIGSEKFTMPKKDFLAPLLSALHDLVAWLQAKKVPGVVIGGVAASLLGRPRVTRDVDVVVILDQQDWNEFLTAGTRFGFVARRPDALKFAQRTRVLLVHHKPSGIDVDVIISSLLYEKEIIEKAIWVKVGGIRIPLPVTEDLIVMKALAHRPRDLVDIEALLDAHPKLNIRKIRRLVCEISESLAMPEILKDLETILAHRRKQKNKK